MLPDLAVNAVAIFLLLFLLTGMFLLFERLFFPKK